MLKKFGVNSFKYDIILHGPNGSPYACA